MPARSDVICPSAHRSLTTWTTVGCSAVAIWRAVTTTTGPMPAASAVPTARSTIVRPSSRASSLWPGPRKRVPAPAARTTATTSGRGTPAGRVVAMAAESGRDRGGSRFARRGPGNVGPRGDGGVTGGRRKGDVPVEHCELRVDMFAHRTAQPGRTRSAERWVRRPPRHGLNMPLSSPTSPRHPRVDRGTRLLAGLVGAVAAGASSPARSTRGAAPGRISGDHHSPTVVRPGHRRTRRPRRLLGRPARRPRSPRTSPTATPPPTPSPPRWRSTRRRCATPGHGPT